MSYDPHDLSCEGCQIRNSNIYSLLNGILIAGKHLHILRDDLTIEEFDGPKALHVLEDIASL